MGEAGIVSSPMLLSLVLSMTSATKTNQPKRSGSTTLYNQSRIRLGINLFIETSLTVYRSRQLGDSSFAYAVRVPLAPVVLSVAKGGMVTKVMMTVCA